MSIYKILLTIPISNRCIEETYTNDVTPNNYHFIQVDIYLVLQIIIKLCVVEG